MILYEKPCPEFTVPNLYAIDTETELIKEPTYGWNNKTRTSPPDVPRLVLGSMAGGGHLLVLSPELLASRLIELLGRGAELVFHNAAFDIPVLCKALLQLRGPLDKAIRENRIHDTMILEVLLQLARGSRTIAHKDAVRSPTLAKLALRRCGIHLNKEGDVRVSFGQYKDQLHSLPQEYLEYAAADAATTYRIYSSQLVEGQALLHQPNCRYPSFENGLSHFGLLSESIQLQGSLAFAWLESFPLRVDLPEAAAVRARLATEAARLQEALISFGFAKRTPKSKKFSVQNKKLRQVLADYARSKEILPEYSDTGLLSLKYDFWAEYLPRTTSGVSTGVGSEIESRLAHWLRYLRIERLLVRYIHPYSSAERHYPRYYNIGARTGRSSATCPPVQQVPKRRDGIRNLFIPEDGHVFLEADFSAAELVALAQVYHNMYGGSVLGDAINAGEDPHIATARRLIPDFDSLPEAERKMYRQAAKAVNFGLPGGLGAAKFRKYANTSYGLSLTADQAKDLRQRALAADPQLQMYLEERHSIPAALTLAAKNLNLSRDSLITHLNAWQEESTGRYNELLAFRRLKMFARGAWTLPTPPGFDVKYDLFKDVSRTLTGRLRGNCSYTEAHNFPFQGLVADAMKLALWNLYVQWIAQPDFQPVASVHDSILVQCYPDDADRISAILHDCMTAAMKTVCPNIRCGVDVTGPLTRWGAGASDLAKVA